MLKISEDELSTEDCFEQNFDLKFPSFCADLLTKQMLVYLSKEIEVNDLRKIFCISRETINEYINKIELAQNFEPYYTDVLRARVSLNFDKKLTFTFDEEILAKLGLSEKEILSWSKDPKTQQEKLSMIKNHESVSKALGVDIGKWLLSDQKCVSITKLNDFEGVANSGFTDLDDRMEHNPQDYAPPPKSLEPQDDIFTFKSPLVRKYLGYASKVEEHRSDHDRNEDFEQLVKRSKYEYSKHDYSKHEYFSPYDYEETTILGEA